MAAHWSENPRVRGSIPRLATRTQATSPFFGVGFLLCGVRYEQRRRGIFQVFDVGTACRRVHDRPLAIRQDCLHGPPQVVAVGVGCSLCLYWMVSLVTSEGKTLPIVGGFFLWAFAAYTIKVAASLRQRS